MRWGACKYVNEWKSIGGWSAGTDINGLAASVPERVTKRSQRKKAETEKTRGCQVDVYEHFPSPLRIDNRESSRYGHLLSARDQKKTKKETQRAHVCTRNRLFLLPLIAAMSFVMSQ